MTEPGQHGIDIVVLVEQAGAATHPIVAAVRPEQWGLPTPCAEWDVRTLTRHLRHGVVMYLAAFGDEAAPGPGAEPTDADLAADIARLDARFVARLREPGALDRELTLPWMTLPAATVAGFRLVDLMVHGWDLARATGQPTDFAPGLHEAALAMSRQALGGMDRADLGGMFADEQAAPAGCSAADRLAAFLGRAV